MRQELQRLLRAIGHTTASWSNPLPGSDGAVDPSLLSDLSCFRVALQTIVEGKSGGLPTALPPAFKTRSVTQGIVYNAMTIAQELLDADAIAVACEVLQLAARRSTDLEPIARAAAVKSAFVMINTAAGAAQHLQAGLENGLLSKASKHPKSRSKNQPPSPNGPARSPSTTGSSDNSNATSCAEALLEALLLRLCTAAVMEPAAALLSAAHHEALAAAKTLPIADSIATATGGDAAAAAGATASGSISDLVDLLYAVAPLLYGVAAVITDQSERHGLPRMMSLATALVKSLEASQLLETACASLLLAVPVPRPGTPVEELEDLTVQLTRATSCLANSISNLAFLAGRGAVEDGDSTTQGGAGRSAVTRQQRQQCLQLRIRTHALLSQPAASRLQRVLLARFCLNAGVQPPQRGSTGASWAAGGCGWPLMDGMRLDHRLCDHCFVTDERFAGYARVPALLTLAWPAVSLWILGRHLGPRATAQLPPDVDELLARVAEGVVRICRGQGEADMRNEPVDINCFTTLIAAVQSCVLQVDLPGSHGAGGGGGVLPGLRPPAAAAAAAGCSPAALESMAWVMAARLQLAAAVEESHRSKARAQQQAAGTSTGTSQASVLPRAEDLDIPVGHWLLPLASLSMHLARQLPKHWDTLSAAEQADAVRRMARAELLASLDHTLRLFATYGEPLVLYECALAAAQLVTGKAGAELLRQQHMAAAGGAARGHAASDRGNGGVGDGGGARDAGSSGSTSADPQQNVEAEAEAGAALRRSLGLFVTVSKLAGRTAVQLHEATDLAELGGFVLHSGSSAALALSVLRNTACDIVNVLTSLCSSVGPVGLMPGMHALSAQPDVAAVGELCARAAVTAAGALVDSVEREQRAVWWPRDASMFSRQDTDRELSVMANRTRSMLAMAPACLTAVAASQLPAPMILALQPLELLYKGGCLVADLVQLTESRNESLGPGVGWPPGLLGGWTTAGQAAEGGQLGRLSRLLPQHMGQMDLHYATIHCTAAVLALAGREDTSAHVHAGLLLRRGAAGSSSGAAAHDAGACSVGATDTAAGASSSGGVSPAAGTAPSTQGAGRAGTAGSKRDRSNRSSKPLRAETGGEVKPGSTDAETGPLQWWRRFMPSASTEQRPPGTSGGEPAVPLGPLGHTVEFLASTVQGCAESLSLPFGGLHLRELLDAAASGGGGGDGGGGEAEGGCEAMRRCAQSCLQEQGGMYGTVHLAMSPMTGDWVRDKLGPHRTILLAMKAAGVQEPHGLPGVPQLPPQEEHPQQEQEQEQQAPPPPQSARQALQALPRMCANPMCGDFSGPCEAVLMLKRCAGCGVVQYCSKQCQHQDWALQHKHTCKLLRG
ncbi:hypothetical protein PLESTB_000866800 [Pleodorina starrii]|uniref:MYND-type domain-containing protein n=1 Tax=Pleodorina starrii TaxID=330485 RepID=A0A9W6BLP2_9CHLO|nr:hypothetical protein PLESTM_001427000 [Pleodorina starrii]GLC54467.1 hypothetical protein PLESTB_000866800 [Pleodorina starrii]GLC72119.1 hypothetical protein PLESTF_001205900 [Pleodorina starrii]